MYDYTNTLLYSAKNHNERKNGKLIYYFCRDFDGKTLIVEELKSPIPYMKQDRFHHYECYIHNLDVLSSQYDISILVKEDNRNGN